MCDKHTIYIIVPIFICVVLPVACVWLVTRARQHEVDQKTALAMKAIENGAELDPNFFAGSGKKPVGIKERVFRNLKAGIILMAIGVMFVAMGLIMSGLKDEINEGLYMAAAIFGSLGLAFLVI